MKHLISTFLVVVASSLMLPAQKLIPGTYLAGTLGWTAGGAPNALMNTVQMINPYTGKVTVLTINNLPTGEIASSFLINNYTSFFMSTKQSTKNLPVAGNVYLVTLLTTGTLAGTWRATRFNTRGGLNSAGQLGINVSAMAWDNSWIYLCGSGAFATTANDAQVWRISRTGTTAGTVFVHSKFGAAFMAAGALGGSHAMVLIGTTLHVFTFDSNQAKPNNGITAGVNQHWSLSTNPNAPKPTQVGQNLPPSYRTSPPSGFASTAALADPRSGNIIVVGIWGDVLWRTPSGTNVNHMQWPGLLSTINDQIWRGCTINSDTWELACADHNGASIDVYRDNGLLPTVNNLVKANQPVPGTFTISGLDYVPTENPSVYHPIGAGCKESSLLGPWSYVNSPPTPGNSSFALTLSTTNATAFLAIGTRFATPFNFGPLGAPGCLLHVNPVAIYPFQPAYNVIFKTKPIPANARGRMFYTQWMVLDPRANALGIALSDARMIRP